MINIILGSTIEYTKDDDFNMKVESESELTTNDRLRFVIAKDETSEPVVDNSYFVNSDLTFILTLSSEDKERLLLGDYIYKLILISADGKVITQLSGDFIVKWGA